MNNIDKQFDELLKTADKIADIYEDENEFLSDDELDELLETMGANDITDPAQLFPSNNGHEVNENTDPSRNIEQTVLVSANPVTGVLNTIPYEAEELTEESIDKLLEMEDEDLRKIEIGWDNFVDTVRTMYPDTTDDELKSLLESVNKYRAGEKFHYFNELPETIKKELHDFAKLSAAENQANKEQLRQFEKMLAKELFETIITQNYSTKAFSDLSKFTISEINKEKDKLGGSVSEFNSNLRKEYEIGFIEKAEALEASDEEGAKEQAEKLRKVSRAFTQSYTYEDMYEAYKNHKIRIKNIQLEKFSRTCQEFNRKYYNNTFKIKDIFGVASVLDRVLDNKYNINAIKKFIVAFINYTRLYSPSNIDEHVFMYYFIQNILALDINIPGNGSEEFNDLVKQNIYKFLDLIIERDAEKEELKKGTKNVK